MVIIRERKGDSNDRKTLTVAEARELSSELLRAADEAEDHESMQCVRLVMLKKSFWTKNNKFHDDLMIFVNPSLNEEDEFGDICEQTKESKEIDENIKNILE
jgi:hypothetical protein